jgi:hypothetical protein
VRILNGEAKLHDEKVGAPSKLCASDATCAAISVDASEISSAEKRAREALIAIDKWDSLRRRLEDPTCTVITCAKDQTVCPGPKDETGMKTAEDTCMPKGLPCPTYCKATEVSCPVGVSLAGETLPNTCLRKGSICPIVCTEEQKVCPSPTEGGQGVCMPKDSYCPVTCGGDKPRHCPGPVDAATGTPSGPATCVDLGSFCPITCPGRKVCPGKTDPATGKPTSADTCVGMDSNCPVHCGPRQKNCPGMVVPGAAEANAVAMASDPTNYVPVATMAPDTCMPMNENCPMHCGPQKKECPGMPNPPFTEEAGATPEANAMARMRWSPRMPGYCAPEDSFCNVYCDAATQTWCSGPSDEATGQQTGPAMCVDLGKPCPVTCGLRQRKCPGRVMDTGTTTMDHCVDQDEYCPVHCDRATQNWCSGPWDVATARQTGPATCISRGESCPVTCGTSQKKCPGKVMTGTSMPDYCVSQDEFCHVTCDDSTQMHCSGPTNFTTGRQIGPAECIPKSPDRPAFCPVYCDIEKDQQLCPGPRIDPASGKQSALQSGPDICEYKNANCPVHCGHREHHCPGMLVPGAAEANAVGMASDPTNYVPVPTMMPDTCVAMGANCPVHCGPRQHQCPGMPMSGAAEANAVGMASDPTNYVPVPTMMPDTCMGIGTNCPVHCGPRQKICGGMPVPGAAEVNAVGMASDPTNYVPVPTMMPDTCVSMNENCPIHCGQHEKECPGMLNMPITITDAAAAAMMPLRMPGYCVPKDGFCSVHCDMATEMHCGGPWDMATNRQTGPDTCVPMGSFCPVTCGEELKLCPGKTDPATGKPESADFCAPKDGFCPVHCDMATEMHCGGPWDMATNRQTGPDTCVPMGSFCPMTCGEDQKLCPGPTDSATGKPTSPGTCAPKDSFCPTHCGDDQVYCMGRMTTNGTKTEPDSCLPAGYFCPANCVGNQVTCPGARDPASGKAIDGETCMPEGSFCPAHCGADQTICPGARDVHGKVIAADTCMPTGGTCPEKICQ